ncbi:hypothetical protein GXW82_03725 [Streptacidiphilus sp. 4-A2]|nr:hypothetical protein [Streptacidiphilus sp. 4-A2]
MLRQQRIELSTSSVKKVGLYDLVRFSTTVCASGVDTLAMSSGNNPGT